MSTSVEIPDSEVLYKMRRSHRVVVTGVGAVSPLGLNMKDTFQGLIEGRSGIRNISTSDWEDKEGAQNSGVDIAGLVIGFETGLGIRKSELDRMHRSARFSLVAAREALIQAGFLDDSVPITKGVSNLTGVEPPRIGAILGTGIAGGSEIATVEDVIQGIEVVGQKQRHKDIPEERDLDVSPFSMLQLLPERISTVPSIWLGLGAEVNSKNAACAAAAAAISDAYRVLERDEADVMVAGGAEAAIHRVGLASFNNMRALNNERNGDPEGASRPFDQEAAGFVMGEGAGILVMETLEHAIGRGANILAELVGYGNTADANHDTAPNQTGAERAMRLALAMGEIDPSEVDYINAHGTSTPTNDPMESKAIKTVYGDSAKNIAISSTKSMTGHLLGAAGGLEAVICIQTIQEGIVPPTLNLHIPIAEAEGLNLVPLEAQKRKVDVAVSNSLGFGGLNAVLVFRRFQMNYERIA